MVEQEPNPESVKVLQEAAESLIENERQRGRAIDERIRRGRKLALVGFGFIRRDTPTPPS
jgi:hypothetical protein